MIIKLFRKLIGSFQKPKLKNINTPVLSIIRSPEFFINPLFKSELFGSSLIAVIQMNSLPLI